MQGTGSQVSQRDDGAPLGRLTGYCPHSGKHAQSAPDPPPGKTPNLEGLLESFRLRARLRRHATDDRIRACGNRVFEHPTIVTEETADGARRARWTGIVLCNRTGCPVCGSAKLRRFRDSVLRLLGGNPSGWWQHAILTVSHHGGESWGVVYSRLLDGLRSLSKGIAGRLVRTTVDATVRATETTWSERNGWHVHFHVLWRLRGTLSLSRKAALQLAWAEATGASPTKGLQFGALFDCGKPHEREHAAHYLSKLALEMTDTSKTAHGEHWKLGELYDRAARGERVELIQEYQRATKGKRLYQLDRRAKQLHDNAPELPQSVVLRTWITVVDRAEFSGLARGERNGDPLAVYLPIEVAARCRGDPSSHVEDAIYSLLQGFS